MTGCSLFSRVFVTAANVSANCSIECNKVIAIPSHPCSQGISRTFTYHVQNSVSTSLLKLSFFFIKLYSQIVPLKSRTKCVDFTCRLLDEFADPDLHVRPPVSTIEQNSIYLLLFKYSNSRYHDVSSRMCFKYLSVC